MHRTNYCVYLQFLLITALKVAVTITRITVQYLITAQLCNKTLGKLYVKFGYFKKRPHFTVNYFFSGRLEVTSHCLQTDTISW